jgi:histidine triad (HIT) family protein
VTETSTCVFCRIVDGTAPANVLTRMHDAVVITPLNPVTEGHVLVIPTVHVADYSRMPRVTANMAWIAAQIAGALDVDSNMITSRGPDATQTVFHMHIHIVPRRKGDNLPLPWTYQHVRAG